MAKKKTAHPNYAIVMDYCESIRNGTKIACKELKQAVERFFDDIDNPEYWIDYKSAEFVIQIIESTICHQQGERIDGSELRGQPFLLEPFHKFIVYNLVGVKIADTQICKYHEALIFIPRKNIKEFCEWLLWDYHLWKW